MIVTYRFRDAEVRYDGYTFEAALSNGYVGCRIEPGLADEEAATRAGQIARDAHALTDAIEGGA